MENESMKKEYLLVLGVLALSAILSAFAWLVGTGRLALPSVSLRPNPSGVSTELLSLTAPVTKIVGRVDKLDGDTLFVTQSFPTGDLTFKLLITPETKIIKPRPFIPYLLKTVHADVADAMGKADLTPGTLVTVTTAKDLRETGTKKSVPSSTVEITVYNTSLSGTIDEVDGSSFTITATVPPLPPTIPLTGQQPKEKTYRVTYSGTTELSHKKDGQAEAVKRDALVKGAAVTVYTLAEVATASEIPAVLIRFTDE